MADAITVDILLKTAKLAGQGGKETVKALGMVEKAAVKASRAIDGAGESLKGIIAALSGVERETKQSKSGFDGLRESGIQAVSVLDRVETSAVRSRRALDGLEGSIRQARRAMKELARERGMLLAEAKICIIPVLERARTSAASPLLLDASAGRQQPKNGAPLGAESLDFPGVPLVPWDELIAEPFREWWNTAGNQMITDTAAGIGTAIGAGLNRSLMALLGVDGEEVTRQGMEASSSFADGFLDGFEPEKVRTAFLDAFKEITPDANEEGDAGQMSSLLTGAVVLEGLGTVRQVIKEITGTYSDIKNWEIYSMIWRDYLVFRSKGGLRRLEGRTRLVLRPHPERLLHPVRRLYSEYRLRGKYHRWPVGSRCQRWLLRRARC